MVPTQTAEPVRKGSHPFLLSVCFKHWWLSGNCYGKSPFLIHRSPNSKWANFYCLPCEIPREYTRPNHVCVEVEHCFRDIREIHRLMGMKMAAMWISKANCQNNIPSIPWCISNISRFQVIPSAWVKLSKSPLHGWFTLLPHVMCSWGFRLVAKRFAARSPFGHWHAARPPPRSNWQ